jgi:hypothetical protein
MWFLTFISAGVGLGIGGVAGVTCRPNLGAVLGGVLSAGACLTLFVLPTELALSMSGGGGKPYPQERSDIMGGLIAMTLAGAIAGGVGASAGSRRRSEGKREGKEEKGNIQDQ